MDEHDALERLAGRLLPDLPVLEEVPELAGLLGRLRLVDQLLAHALEEIIRLQETSLAEEATGVALEQWLGLVARRTGTDRRMLATAAEVCRRLPSVRDAFARDRLSWAQLRTVCLQVHRLPRHLDDRLDEELATGIEAVADADPDAIVHVVRRVVASVEEAEAPERSAPPRGEFLHLQPRLDGTGGRIYGEAGAESFALLDAHLSPGLDPAEVEPTRDRLGGARDPDRARRAAAALGQRRLRRLLDLLRAGAGGHRAPATTATGPDAGPGSGAPGAVVDPDGPGAEDGAPAGPPGPRPLVILRSELDTLLHGRGDAQLLTHLAGGRMTVDAATARRLAQEHGADLRLVLTDAGRVVGVGRRQRFAPEWIDEALLALHDTCTAPGCTVAARACQTDHARPWGDDGPTDLANCAPMCAHDNDHKDREGWRVRGATDGSRTWHHPRSGLTTRTYPTTWEPPGGPPPLGQRPPGPHRRRHRPRAPSDGAPRDGPPGTVRRGPGPPGDARRSRPADRPAREPPGDDLPF